MNEDKEVELIEPVIEKDQVHIIEDSHFTPRNVCIVTGAASGIGRATAIAMAANNTTVIGADVNSDGGVRTVEMAEDLGGKVVFVKTDLTKDEDIENCVREAAKCGSIKFLANIAGMQHIDPMEKFPMGMYDKMQKIMLRAPFCLSKLCISYMRTSEDSVGVIGNMASVHAHICTLNKPAYNIMKFGLRGLSQSIAAEGEGKIRSFSVSVGFVKTPLTLGQVSAQAKQRKITPKQVITEVMLGKSRVKEMMSPIEVANLFAIGFSHLGKYLVGGDLLFDGGMVLTY